MSLSTSVVRHAPTDFWVGSAEISRMGFPVPLSSSKSPAVPLVFIPSPELDRTRPTAGRHYRIQSGQHGLQRADHWFNAVDITVPSIIYRDWSPYNNPLGFAFLLVPLGSDGNTFGLQSAATGQWVTVDSTCGRLVTTPICSKDCEFRLFSKS